MPEASFGAELLGGLAGAVVVPFLLGLTWGRFVRAGVVGGIVLATLLHVTVGLLVVSLGYRGAEWLARRSPVLATALAVAAVVAAVAAFALAVT